MEKIKTKKCFKCKQSFPLKELIETVNPAEVSEYYCQPCLDEIDKFFRRERWERLKREAKRLRSA